MSINARLDLIDQVCLLAFISVLYAFAGLFVLMLMDSRPRYTPITDRLRGIYSLVALVVWPLTALWLHWRSGRAK